MMIYQQNEIDTGNQEAQMIEQQEEYEKNLRRQQELQRLTNLDMADECDRYLKTREIKVIGLTKCTDREVYLESDHINYIETAILNQLSLNQLSLNEYITYQRISPNNTIRIFSLYIDFTYNVYCRKKSETFMDTLDNEDEVYLIGIANCSFNWFSVGLKESTKINLYVPKRSILFYEKQIDPIRYPMFVVRMYLINSYLNENGEVMIDKNTFYKSNLIQ